MEAKTAVTRFFRNTTCEDRRKFYKYGIYRHNIAEVINRLERSPLRLNFPAEIQTLLKHKILEKKLC